MVSIAHVGSYYQLFLSQGIGMGIGAGCLYVPALAIQAHHWKAKRALAMGIVVTGMFSSLPLTLYLNHGHIPSI
jgi:MFS family permease